MKRYVALAAGGAVLALAACGTARTATPSSPAHLTAVSHYQFGVDLDFYWHPGQAVTALISQEAEWARGLGANSVLISFPFYTDRRTAFAGKDTPSPAVLAEAIRAARSHGLTVGVRPLLDEKNIPPSRTQFRPVDVAAWLSSYQPLAVSYARAAQQAGATRFYVGAELSEFAHDPGWDRLDSAVRGVFSGSLYFSANWVNSRDTSNMPGSGGTGIQVSADAYQGMAVAPSGFAAAWKSKASVLPAGTVLSEVGIAARQGVQRFPYQWRPSDAPLDPQLQLAWFTAACNAVRADHLGGIYFWSVYVGQPLNLPPTPQTANSFVDSPGAVAIRACFSMLGGAR
jgi:hypothetical protein